MEIMTPKNKNWKKFCKLLEGKEGCNFTGDSIDKVKWNCKGGHSKFYARKILKKYFSKINIPNTVKYFDSHGVYCDCEILFNL